MQLVNEQTRKTMEYITRLLSDYEKNAEIVRACQNEVSPAGQFPYTSRGEVSCY